MAALPVEGCRVGRFSSVDARAPLVKAAHVWPLSAGCCSLRVGFDFAGRDDKTRTRNIVSYKVQMPSGRRPVADPLQLLEPGRA